MGTTTFQTFWRELTGQVPELDAILAQKLVNRARVDIYEAHKWSFLFARTIVPIPASISTGLVAVTANSSTITFDADAIAVLDLIGLPTPITERQIKINGSAPYNILTYETGTGIATITPTLPTSGTNPGYVGATDSAATYVLAKRYYAPPSVDFLRWVSVINQTVPYKFWTNVPVQKLDFFDPKRMIVGNPYVITQYAAGTDPAGSGAEVPLYELWPTPSYDTQMVQVWMKRGSDFSGPTDTLPEAIPDDLLMERAKYRAYEWAMANQGRIPALKGTNWAALMQLSNAEYKTDLAKYKKQDKETFAQAEIIPSTVGMFGYPMWDATYMQLSSLAPDFVYNNFGFPW